MLKVMSEAECLNDPALDDYETLRFEERLAKDFNKEAAIFFLTSSMSNLAAVLLHTRPGSEVILASSAHTVERECASMARIAGVQTRQIFTESGLFTPQQGKLSNGTYRGQVWDLNDLRQIKKIAEENKVAVHIDGARIYNALETYGLQPKDISDCYDTMTMCFTKGLCCPVGGAILGTREHIKKLKSIRKSLGGGIMHTSILSTGI
ncbi:uncharacterized protein LOC116268317 [Nymphaea colorata]|nr:uncharacterized protein LOC116268317 [Nymphaea colorata]